MFLLLLFNPKPLADPEFHIPLQCNWLKLNGSWPLKSAKRSRDLVCSLDIAYICWSWLVIICVGITIAFQTAFLVRTFGDIIMTTENCCTTLMGALNFVRLLHLRLNQSQFKDIIEQFVNDIWIVRGTNSRIERVCEKNMNTFRIISILLSCLILMYCILPLIELFTLDDIAGAEKPFPYKMLFPYDAHHGWRYGCTYIFTSFAGLCVVTTLFAEDSIFGFFVTYTCGQFRILHNRIDELVTRPHEAVLREHQRSNTVADGNQLTVQCQREYVRELNEIARKHNVLIQFANRLEHFFNTILLVNFVISSILICMVGFQLVTGKDMFIGDYAKFLVYISASMSQLYVLCWNGNLLIEHSTETAQHLYDCNWESGHSLPMHSSTLDHGKTMDETNQWSERRKGFYARATHAPAQHYCPADKEFRRNLQFMIMCSQRPVKITALKFSTLSLQSFTAILSTSMSYFALLQTLFDEDQSTE